MFGKSFNDIGTAIIGRITDINKAFQATNGDLIGSLKDSDSIWKRLYPSKESIKEQLIDIDSLIPEIDKNKFDFDGWINKLNSIDKQVKAGTLSWQDYSNRLDDNEKWIAKWGQETEGQIRTQSDLVKANQQARASALAQNEAIKAQTLSAKAGKVALGALATVGSMFLMLGITKAIEWAVKGIDNLIHSAEHCKERVDGLMSSYHSALDKANSNAKTIEELAGKYETLSKGVNQFGENVSLTADEYAEYNNIVNQIADMFPTLVKGYTDEGNAVLSLRGNVEQLRDAYKEAQREAYNLLIVDGKDSDGNDILKNAKNIITGSTVGSHDWGNVEKIEFLNRLMDAAESVDGLLNLWNDSLGSAYYEWFEDFAGVGGTANIGKLTEEDLADIKRNAKILMQQYQAEINSAIENVETIANAYFMTNPDYEKLDKQSKTAASIMLNSFNEEIVSGFGNKKENVGKYVDDIIQLFQSNPKFKDAAIELFTMDMSDMSISEMECQVDKYIETLAEFLGEDELELKIRLGFEDVDTLARNYNTVLKNAAAKFTGTDLSGFTRDIFRDKSIPDSDKYTDYEQEMEALEAFAAENSINTQDEVAFWNKCIEESETREEAIEKYLASPFVTGEGTPAPSLSNTITQLNTQLKPAFDSLQSAYNGIFTSDGFTLQNVDVSMLDSMKSKLDDLNAIEGIRIDYSSFENLARVLTDTSSTTDDVKTAFNLLATDIVAGLNPALSDCSGENYRLVQSLLESAGITNAEAVMVSSLGYNYEDYAAAKRECAAAGFDLTDKAEQEIEKFTMEQIAAENCGQALALLQLKKALCRETALTPGSDINSLYQLAKAAGIATEQIGMLAGLNAAYEKEAAAGHTQAALAIAGRMAEVKADVEKQFAEIGNMEVDFSAKVDKGASAAAAKQEETDYKNLLDAETNLLEQQLAANIITFQEYTDRQKQIIDDYYRDGKIKVQDYYDALADMYAGQLSHRDKAIRAVEGTIDREISRLNEQKEAIENSYQVKIDAIQSEIDALNKANDARKTQIDLEKAQYEAERARNQRVNKVFDGSQFVYSADEDAIRDAEDTLADRKLQSDISILEGQITSLKTEMENATKSLDLQIGALEAYKGKWNEISGVYEEQQNRLIAAEILGADWETQILDGRLGVLQSFTEQYIALQQAQADAAVNAARIKAEADAGNPEGGNVGSAPDTQILGGTETKLPPPGSSQKQSSSGTNGPHYNLKMQKFHDGLDEGYAGNAPSGSQNLKILQSAAQKLHLNADEVPAVLRTGELVLTPEQQQNIVRNARMAFLRSNGINPETDGYGAISHIQSNPQNVYNNISINCPNVTNSTGAEYILKSLQRLPLDTIQYTHRRQK